MRDQAELTSWQEKWNQYYDEWGVLKQDHDNEQWAVWENLLLEKFLEWQEKQKARLGVQAENVPEEVQRIHLRRLVQGIKEIPPSMHTELVERFLDDQYRMGPLQKLWEDPEVSDIQVFVPVDPSHKQRITYVKRGRRMVYNGPGFRDYAHARIWINKHVSRFGLRFDPSKVQLDASAPDGERIHVIAGPVGYSTFENGKYQFVPCLIISIRRFVSPFTLDDLTDRGPVTWEVPENVDKQDRIARKARSYKRRTVVTKRTGGMADPATMDFLRIMVEMGKNHIISGGTGIGKTTLANALTAAIPEDEVLLILEESPEMQPQRSTNVIRLYERKDSMGNTIFSLADGLKAALRMFPDRIFVSEIRDTLAFVFLQAIQSGHDGSSTTVHASSCEAAIERVIGMAISHPASPDRQMVRDILFDRVDTVVHGQRFDKHRFFDEVVQLRPDGKIHRVMEFVQEGVGDEGEPLGYWVFHGPTDEFVEEMLRRGYRIPASWGWEEGAEEC